MLRSKHNRRGLSTLQIVLIVVAAVIVLLVTCVGLFTALMLPALGQARQAAQGIMSVSQISLAEMWREQYATSASEGEQPQFTWRLLIDNGDVTPDLAQSPRGPVSDGRDDYWLNPVLAPHDEHGSPGEFRIASYDRAMYESDRQVAVCFYGNDCELVDIDEFHRLLELPINADTDFDLPTRVR